MGLVRAQFVLSCAPRWARWREAMRPTSHDAVFHTVLPLFGVASPAYDPTLDLLAGCRGAVEQQPLLLSQRNRG